MKYQDRVSDLRRRLRELESAVVAFSGGVDSAVLAAVAHEELKDNMCAATAISASIPKRDREVAVSFCKDRGIPHSLIETKEFFDETYVKNPEDRCYFCKKALYDAFEILLEQKGFRYIVEGTNASDLKGHRPGHKASRLRKNVSTPLIDAGLTKDDVRRFARETGLVVADKPSSACLSSRIPTGTRLSPDLLRKIDDAEEAIRSLGISQVRVRHHDELARVEILPGEFARFLERRLEVKNALLKLGYKFVTLDVTGYRTGGTQG